MRNASVATVSSTGSRPSDLVAMEREQLLGQREHRALLLGSAWSIPSRCRRPWTVSSCSSACAGMPRSARLTMRDGRTQHDVAEDGGAAGGDSPGSSIGNASTSVGPLVPEVLLVQAAMVGSSTSSSATSMSAGTRRSASTDARARRGRRRRPRWSARPRGRPACQAPPPLDGGWAAHPRPRRDGRRPRRCAARSDAARRRRVELRERDALDVTQDLTRDDEAGSLPLREVGLADVSGDDRTRVEADPRQEHLHLFGRRVLRLVEDDERVVERASAHVGERCDLDDPTLDMVDELGRVHHVLERVPQRLQVRVDLLVQGPREEAEPLPGLDGGPGEDETVHLARPERTHRRTHREVRLARAGRTDAERDRVLRDRVEVAPLADGLRADRAAAVGDEVLAEHVGGAPGTPSRTIRMVCSTRRWSRICPRATSSASSSMTRATWSMSVSAPVPSAIVISLPRTWIGRRRHARRPGGARRRCRAGRASSQDR
jgi:hypothetical protein